MNDSKAKITFDITKCRTFRRGQTDLFDCLAKEQVLICGHSLPFGYGHFCRHPQRDKFLEELPGKVPANPSQADKFR